MKFALVITVKAPLEKRVICATGGRKHNDAASTTEFAVETLGNFKQCKSCERGLPDAFGGKLAKAKLRPKDRGIGSCFAVFQNTTKLGQNQLP